MSQLDETFQLVIAGECYGSFEKYQHQINASNAAGRIHVYNQYIKDDEIATYFSAADALILPYRSATQSGVVSIAYHFNVPMISTPVGDFPDSISTPGTVFCNNLQGCAVYFLNASPKVHMEEG
jgi:glycosyltransferase involved in cell wall biosynthesis